MKSSNATGRRLLMAVTVFVCVLVSAFLLTRSIGGRQRDGIIGVAVQGRLVDPVTNTPIELATVHVFEADDRRAIELIASASSSADGRFIAEGYVWFWSDTGPLPWWATYGFRDLLIVVSNDGREVAQLLVAEGLRKGYIPQKMTLDMGDIEVAKVEY